MYEIDKILVQLQYTSMKYLSKITIYINKLTELFNESNF